MKLAEHPLTAIQPLTTRRQRGEWLLLVGVLLTMTAAVATVAYRDHTRITANERTQLQTQARVIEENLVRQLQGVDSVLTGIRYDLASGDTPQTPESTSRRLKTLSDALPGVRAIYALDARGIVIASDQSQFLGMDLHKRAYFTMPKAGRDDTLVYVSPPYRTLVGNFVINLSKSMTAADGSFAGIATAALDQTYFEILMRSVIYAPDMRVSLIHGEGAVFLASPPDEKALGTNQNQPGSAFQRFRAGKTTAEVIEENPADSAAPRMLAMHLVMTPSMGMDKPLVISVARDLAAIYAPWKEQTKIYAVFWSLLLLGSGLALHLSQSRRRTLIKAHDAVLAAQRLTAQRFEFGLKGADLGLWDWNIAEDRLTVNDRQWQILGYEPNEVVLNSAFWQALLHPDDWPALQTAYRAHIKQGTQAYKIEHRLRHKDGRWIWVLDHAMVIERNARGKAQRVLGTHLDISDRKQAEEAQRNIARRLELAMKSGNIGLLDWHVPSGAILLNEQGLSILGYHEGGEVFTADRWKHLRHPDDESAIRAALTALLVGEADALNLEYRMRHAAGHSVWIHMRAEIVERDAAQQPLRLIGIYRDISQRKQAEADLASAMALQRRTGELARVGGWELPLPDGRPVWTDEIYRIYGLGIGTPLDMPQSLAGYAPEARQRLEEALREAAASGTPWDLELQMTTALGRPIWVRSRCEVVLQDGRPVRLVGTIQDTTERTLVQLELQHANAQLAELSMTDGLTGVANRRQFDQSLAGEWSRSTRQQLPLALLMIDIDHFKAYNDARGHQGGDTCLRDVAHILARCAWRPGELLARYGGEEFAILLPGSTLEDARAVAQRCLDRIQQAGIPHPASDVSQWLTISIGIASLLPGVGASPESLVAQADAALYGAKRNGRARFECAVG